METYSKISGEGSKNNNNIRDASSVNFKTMALLKKQENLLSEFETNLQKTISSLTGSKSISPSLAGSAHKSPASIRKLKNQSLGIKIAEDEEVTEVRPFSNKKYLSFLAEKNSAVDEVSESNSEENEDRLLENKEERIKGSEKVKGLRDPHLRFAEENQFLNEKCLSLQNELKDVSEKLKKECELKLLRAERTFNEIAAKEKDYIEEIKNFEERESKFQMEKRALEDKVSKLEATLKTREDEFLLYGEELMKDFQAKTIAQLQKEREKYEREVGLLHQELAKEKMEKHSQTEAYQKKNLKLYNLVLELEKEKGDLLCGRVCVCQVNKKTGVHFKSEYVREFVSKMDETGMADIFTNEKINKNIKNSSGLNADVSFQKPDQDKKVNFSGDAATANKILDEINMDLRVFKKKNGIEHEIKGAFKPENCKPRTLEGNEGKFACEIQEPEKAPFGQEESVYENLKSKFNHSISDNFEEDSNVSKKIKPNSSDRDLSQKNRNSNKENINPVRVSREKKNHSLSKFEVTPSKKNSPSSGAAKKGHQNTSSLKVSNPSFTSKDNSLREKNKKKSSKGKGTPQSIKSAKIPVYSKI